MKAQVVVDFLAVVRDPSEEKLLRAFRLTRHQMDVFLAALNALPDDSLVIPDLNGIVKTLGLGLFYIQNLKKKGYFKAGSGRGEWVMTDKAMDTLASFLEGKSSDVPPKVEGKTDKTEKKGRKRTKKVVEKKVAPDFGGMSVSQIMDRLKEIDDLVDTLEKEKETIQEWLREQLTLLAGS
jgi:hypothetical protein